MFLKLRAKNEVTDDEWIEFERKQKRKDSLLNFFNTKYTPLEERRDLIRRCMKDRKRAAAELRDQQSQQIERGLEVLENINTDNRRKYETHCLTFEKWQKVHRFTSMGALEEYMTRVDPLQPSKEHSHAQKIEIVRRQLQLRKQYDGVTKMGDLTITNRAGKDDPSPENGLLDMLLEDFRVVLQHESIHGIKAPKVPELVKPRDSVVGSTSLAKKLLQDQREKAAAQHKSFLRPTP